MNIREAKEAHNGAVVKVQGYISEIRQVTASTGTEYMQFTIRDKEGTIQSKIWSGKLYDDIKNNGFSAGVYEIDGKINEYNGTKSIITNGLHGLETVLSF